MSQYYLLAYNAVESRWQTLHERLFSLCITGTCFHAGFLLGLFFDPEDGSDMFLVNVG
jgi:hypothetical protein